MEILLIDDEPTLIQEALQFSGYRVDVARDGYQGMLRLQAGNKKYQLIILDVRMPILNGWDALKLIRENHNSKETYVVMLTANDLEASVIKGLTIGADEYLVKPISPSRLLAHIKAIERRITAQNKDEDMPLCFDAYKQLTTREKEIISLVAKGLSNKEISEQLSLSTVTVKNHLVRAYQKLGVTSRTQAIFRLQKGKDTLEIG